MFENRKSSQDIHYSRYIASYRNMADKLGHRVWRDDFRDWLVIIGLAEEEVNDIIEMMFCGKIELETSASTFLRRKEEP